MFKRILSAVVATALTVGLLPQIDLLAEADEVEERIPWRGYEIEKGVDIDSLDFDVWDYKSGVVTTDWYNEASGTEDDPYIIRTASDLAGIQALINDSTQTYFDYYYATEADYGNAVTSRAVELWDYTKSITDPTAHYYTEGALYNPTFTLNYRYTLSDPVSYIRRTESLNSYGEPIYTDYEYQAQWFTSFYIDVYLGDMLVKTIDWMQYAIDYFGGLDILIDPTREDPNFSYFTRFDEGEVYVVPYHSGGLAYYSDASGMRDLFRSYGTVSAASITPDTDTITLSCYGLVPNTIGFYSSTDETIVISGELNIPEGTTATNYLGETIDLSGQNYKNYKMRNATSSELQDKLTTEVYISSTSPVATTTSSGESDGLEQHSESSVSINAAVAGDTYTGFPNSIEHADDLYEAQLYFRQTIDTVLDENRYAVNTVRIYGPDDTVYKEYVYKSTSIIPSNITGWYSTIQAKASYNATNNTVVFAIPDLFKYRSSNKTYSVEFIPIGDEVEYILLDCIGEVAKVTEFVPIVDEALHTDYEPTMSVIGSMSALAKTYTKQRWKAYCDGTLADAYTQSCLFENSYFRLEGNIDLGTVSGLTILSWQGSIATTFKGGFDLNGHYIIGNRSRLFSARFAPEAYIKNGTIASELAAVSGGTLENLDLYTVQSFFADLSINRNAYRYTTYTVDHAKNVNLTTYIGDAIHIDTNDGNNINVKILNCSDVVSISWGSNGDWTDSSVTCDVPIVTSGTISALSTAVWTLHNCNIDLDITALEVYLPRMTAYDSVITLDFKTDRDYRNTMRQFYNCDVFLRLPKGGVNMYASNKYGMSFFDSTVHIMDNGSYATCYILYDASNTVFNIDLSLPVIPPLFYNSLLENSTININQLDTSQENAAINSSTMYAVFDSCAIDSCQISVESDGMIGKPLSLFSSCYICNSDIEVDTGVAYDLNGYSAGYRVHRGSLYDNTNISCFFRTPNTYSSTPDRGSAFRNSNIFMLWGNDAVGEVGDTLCISSLYKSTVLIKGPKSVIYNNRLLSVYDMGPLYSTRAGVPSIAYGSRRLEGTFIADGVTLAGSNAGIISYLNDSRISSVYTVSGLHVFADINTKDVEGLSVVGCPLGSSYQVTGVGSILNAYDYYDCIPYSGSINMLRQDSGYMTIVNDAYFKANVESADAALLTGFNYALAPSAQRLLYNIYMNLPNAKQLTNRSESAEGFRSGLFGYWSNSTDAGVNKILSSYVAIATQKSPLTYSNVFVPEGQSFIYEYYNPDTTTADTWNAFETMQGSNFGLVAPTFTNRDEFDFDYVPEGAYYVQDWETAELDGSLAYALDHGTNHYRRTTNWTVVDDVDIYDPLTGEYILTIDKHLGHTNEYFPDSVTNRNAPNLNAIYKISVNKAVAGGIEITGVDGKSTTDGAVYARYGSNPITGVVTDDEDKTLVYAMQSINESIPIRLRPSRLTDASYSVRDDSYNGFTMPSADIEITPVFKVARYITVELSGESGHGALVPSVDVSAEGEEITLDVSSDTDYLVTNIQVNGNPIEDFRFFMPDEDVKITAEVIPFEGGITRFSLGGFAGIIDQNRHTITFNIPRITGIQHMKPNIEYIGTSISPSGDEYLDFTDQQTYVVTYGPDDSKVTYTVNVNMGSYDMRIHDFVIDGVHGSINQARKTIDITLPNGADLTDIVPESIAFSAESISPAVDTVVDFNVPRTYTLTADGLASVTYLVTVKTTSDEEAALMELRIGGYDATIDEATKTAIINVPKLTDLSGILPNIVRYTGKTISRT